jgi:hypothetical protein
VIVAVLIGILAVVLVGFIVASFFVRRHAESPAPQAGWTRTTEVFRDPSSQRLMRVWLDQAGNRHYVAEGDLPSEP